VEHDDLVGRDDDPVEALAMSSASDAAVTRTPSDLERRPRA
jgi:hypothetical protein